MSKVIIIGSGPAGVSASLYTARAGIETTIISTGYSALKKAEKIENYYGFEDPVSGSNLEESGINGAKRLGVNVIEKEVVGLSFEDTLVVKTVDEDLKADGVIIATGSPRFVPKITGITQFEGKGVSYCAVCDAFFYRGKDVAVLGDGEYAVHEALELLPVAKSVTILTNGKPAPENVDDNIIVNTQKINSLTGDERLSGVEFYDGSTLDIEGVFIAFGVAGSADLARKIGAITVGKDIQVDENMATNIPGLFAAGDCTGGLLQISKAVGEGAKAGTQLVKYLRK
ncbi:MAG: NAD(P)/FAD-dependent oxidoreductase [Acutalibacteraceae bacterium]|jgi:thioredoxin reductase (NADPH)|nr:NAD(P)/FAD-dependent oxidoreductase [Clostridiales bacterium]